MTMAHSNVFPITLFFFSVFITLSKAQMVPAIYVFGDSLANVGNNNYLKISLAKAKFPHNGVDFPNEKATGRFGNGKNAADFLGKLNNSITYIITHGYRLSMHVVRMRGREVGLPTSPPYLSLVSKSNKQKPSFVAGVSYASGGAGIFNGSVEQYRIRSFGTRKFVVVGTRLVGGCPAQRALNDGECNEDANSMSVHYNDGLKSMLQELKAALHVNYTFFETYSVITDIIQNTASYGFTETEAACCGIGSLKPSLLACQFRLCAPIEGTMSSGTDSILQRQLMVAWWALFGGPSEYTFPTNVKELIAP